MPPSPSLHLGPCLGLEPQLVGRDDKAFLKSRKRPYLHRRHHHQRRRRLDFLLPFILNIFIQNHPRYRPRARYPSLHCT